MKRLIPLVAIIASSGCASIFSGTTQDVSIRTTPGARYTISDSYGKQVASGTSEGTAKLERGAGYFSPHAYTARITKPGHQPRTIDITPGVNPWYFANILIGGVVGMVIVDPLTGAMYKLYPSDIDVTLDASPDAGPTVSSPAAAPAIIKVSTAAAISRNEYAASQAAKAQGCTPTDAPAFDGRKDPAETLIFTCTNGRKVAVVCDNDGSCR